MFLIPCAYHVSCPLFRNENITCMTGGNYCGRWREFEEKRKE